MMLRYLLLMYFCAYGLGQSCAVLAQQQLLLTQYFEEDKGLNVTNVGTIFQDREGFLWLGTGEGLIRYDGYTFKNFCNQPGDPSSLGYNRVSCITEDKAGNLWVGLVRGGVSCYDRKSGRFTNYRFTDQLKIKTAPVLHIFFDRQGEMWIGTAGYGVVHFTPKTGALEIHHLVTTQNAPHCTPEEISYHNTAQQIWQDENGLLWCATSDDLYTLDPITKKVQSHRFEKVAKDGIRLNQAFTLFPDGDLLWVGGWGSGLRSYNRKTGEWKQFMMRENAFPSDYYNIVIKVAAKSPHELWVSSADAGLCIFNKKTQRLSLPEQDSTELPNRPKSPTSSFIVDRQGNLWLNHNYRLTRIQLKNKQFHFHPIQLPTHPESKLPRMLISILDDREGRFRFFPINYNAGLILQEKRTGKTHQIPFPNQAELTNNAHYPLQIFQDKSGTIWVLGLYNLYRFNPASFQLEPVFRLKVTPQEAVSNYFTRMTEDQHNNLWIGSAKSGVFRYTPASNTHIHFLPDESREGALPTKVIGLVHSDGYGRVWFGSRDKTAYGYYAEKEDRFYYLDANGAITKELTSVRINSYFTDRKGDTWVCTEQGVLHFDCSGEKPRFVQKYTIADGLPSDYVTWGTEDLQGYIWLVTGSRLTRLQPTTGEMQHFGKQEGYPGNYGIGLFEDGSVYLLANNGFYTFQPDSLRSFPRKASLVLTSFKVNDKEQYQGSGRDQVEPLVVPDDGRFFSFEFTALDLANPELCRYEYQLEGFDKGWVNADNRHFVNYTNIPAGRYWFKVKLEDSPDDTALVVPILVQVAFYKTNWFWIAVLLVVVGVITWLGLRRQAGLRQMRVLKDKAQLLEKEKALMQYETLRQQLNPHFLFNSLTSLSSLISIDTKAAIRFLDGLSKTYRYILKSSERELAPLSEEIKFGETFVNLQKTRFGPGLQVRFFVEEEDLLRKVVPVTLQNLIENAIKHNIIDEESPLVIDIFTEKGYLVVRNNLQKKKFVETSNKRGLANLKSFYRFLSDRPIEITEDAHFYTIKIPLI